jgi:hypothetical protein
MRGRLIGTILLAGAAMTLAGPLLAQHPDTTLSPEDQLAPSQMKQPVPGAVPAPAGTRGQPASKHGAAPASPSAAANTRTVTCSGAFAKDSSNLKLAMVFDPKNVTFTDVEINGAQVGASVLFAKDPKRRLEIWWGNQANRSDTYLILINGQSTWTAPGGLRLGLSLADLQKLNRKPFKIQGFDKNNVAAVSDWDDGALATIPGGCKSGVSLQADPKADADALSAFPADKDFSSDDAALRGIKAKVSEILIGY